MYPPNDNAKSEREVFDDVSDVTDKSKSKDKEEKVDEKEDEQVNEEEENVDEGEGAEKDEGEVDEDGDEKGDEEEEGEKGEDEGEEINESDELYQQIKAAAPKIFKEVPELRRVIFREQELTRIVGSPKEAAELVEQVDTYKQLENDIVSGNTDVLIGTLAEVGKDKLENFLAELMPSIQKHDKELYANFVTPAIKEAIRFALRSTDDRIKISAKNLHVFLFGDDKIDSELGLKAKPKGEKESEVDRQRKEFEAERYNAFASDVTDTITNRVSNLIGIGLKELDLSQLTKKHISKEIFDRVDEAIKKDGRFQATLKGLWQNAQREKFTSKWKDSITNAYLSRAKLLIPRKRQEVLSESRISSKSNGNDEESREKKRIPTSHGVRNVSSGRAVDRSKRVDWDKTSERDILDGKVTYRS